MSNNHEIDMSAYPDVDPDTAVSLGDLALLRAELAGGDLDLPEETWDAMVAEAVTVPADAYEYDEDWSTSPGGGPAGFGLSDDDTVVGPGWELDFGRVSDIDEPSSASSDADMSADDSWPPIAGPTEDT